MSLQELKRNLMNVEYVKENRFTILKQLCEASNNGDSEVELQDCILRLMENRNVLDGYGAILMDLVRRVGLFPYLTPADLSIADKVAYEFHRPLNTEKENIVFHRIQAEVYRLIMDGRSVILSAPTSFGKSLIIDAVIASQKFNNIVIVVPTLALMDETRRRLAKYGESYKIITQVEQEVSDRNIFVFTQERVVDYPNMKKVDFFVIDEFYKLNPAIDHERSITLNFAFYKLLKLAKQFYMLGPNIKEIPKGFTDKYDCVFYSTDYSTVASDIHRITAGKQSENTLASLCKELHDPTLVFCASPGKVRKVATTMLEEKVGKKRPTLEAACDWISKEYHPEWIFVEALRSGIGLHHGRIPRALAQFVVRAFNEGHIRYLLCTSTLIEGVNTKAKNVIIYDNKIAKQKYDYFTFNNIKGRSGRMFHHFIGHVYIFHEPPEEELPFVDIPVFTQNQNTPESLLIQLQDNDLTPESSKRIERYKDEKFLSFATLQSNSGIEPADQVALAEELTINAANYRRLLSWTRYPDREQLIAVCELIWKYFSKVRGRVAGVSSGKQLAYKINRLRRKMNIAQCILDELSGTDKDVNNAVDAVLDFNRHWASYHFPTFLMALDRIQKDVFARVGYPIGDYTLFAEEVKHLFMNPAISALDEYGIPSQISKKIQNVVKFDKSFDATIKRLKKTEWSKVKLSAFEGYLLDDVLAHI